MDPFRSGAGCLATEAELVDHGADVLAEVVAFLSSEPARFISGTALQVDGAATTALS